MNQPSARGLPNGPSRSRRVVRWSILSVAGLLVAGLGVFIGTLASADPSFTSAQEGDPTYQVDGEQLERLEDGSLIVRFDTSWADGVFPGYATCRASVYTADGSLIIDRDFQYASFVGPDTTTIDIPTDEQASAEASSADVECSAGTKPSATAGYDITNPQVIPGEEWEPPHLVFDVAWLTEEAPLYQDCSADLRLADGSTREYLFGISLGSGERGDVLLTDAFAGAEPLSITCAAFTGGNDG